MPFDIELLPVLNSNPDNNGSVRRSGMIALVNFTGIHAAGATDALAHIDDRPFTAIHALYHGNRMGRADADTAAAAFTFFPIKIIRCNQLINMRFFHRTPPFVPLYYSKNIRIKLLQKQQNGAVTE